MIDLLNIEKVTIENIKEESNKVKTLVLKPERNILFKPGQFILLSRLGVGESPFAISSNPLNNELFEVSVQRVGKNTSAIHELDKGETIWYRGPYGNYFPVEQWIGKKIVIIAGGIGIAPLRSLLYSLLSNRQSYDEITLLYGANTSEMIIYKDELDKWKKDISVHIITEFVENENLGVKKGLVTNLIDDLNVDVNNCIAVICGPRQMCFSSAELLKAKGMCDYNIFVSLEMKMKCGIGVCGRCNINHKYVCKDGPIFCLGEDFLI